MRDPEWRSEIAVRIGVPVLGGMAAVMIAWFITQL
jgi:hypothetical protein